MVLKLSSAVAGMLRQTLTYAPDDGVSAILHLVLLLVMGGILIGLSTEVIFHRKHITWLPGCTFSIIAGAVLGGAIRLSRDAEEQVPTELLFSGSILFLICIPVIIFNAGFSLRKKEYLGSLFTIITFSVLGTLLSAAIMGTIFYGASSAGLCIPLSWNECMAFAALLSSTDAVASATIYSALGVDPGLMTLIGGEGSLNDAVAIVLYETFAEFVEAEQHHSDHLSNPSNHDADESGTSLFAAFCRMLFGSLFIGLSLGVACSILFRYIHIGAGRDRGLIAFHDWLAAKLGCGRCRRGSGSGSTKPPGGRVSERTSLVGQTRFVTSVSTVPASAAAAAGGASDTAGSVGATASTDGQALHITQPDATPDSGASTEETVGPNDDDVTQSNLLQPYASINAVRAGSAASGARKGLDGFGAHGGASIDPVRREVKPDSSIFAQTTFVVMTAYFSYMVAESFHLSGVVASLFTAIAVNNFVRPLMTKEGKDFSEGTVRQLAATSETGSFFQVGVSIAMTIGTVKGIDSGSDFQLLGWTILAVLLSRAVAIMLLGSLVNYLRRPEDRIPVPWLALLWHSGLRGAQNYAFALVFPGPNKDVLADTTAAIVLLTVIVLGCTTEPAVRLLGVEYGGHHDGEHQQEGGTGHGETDGHSSHGGHGHGGGDGVKRRSGKGHSSSSSSSIDHDIPHAALVMSAGVPYRVFVKSGARVVVPVAHVSASEKTASWMSKVDAKLRYYISGIVRKD